MVCIFHPFVVLFFFFPRIRESINLSTEQNLKFLLPFQERLDAWMEILYSPGLEGH